MTFTINHLFSRQSTQNITFRSAVACFSDFRNICVRITAASRRKPRALDKLIVRKKDNALLIKFFLLIVTKTMYLYVAIILQIYIFFILITFKRCL